MKPQYVDHIPRSVKGRVEQILASKDERKVVEELKLSLDLSHLGDRTVDVMSGGELQRFAIAVTAARKADV